MREYPVYTSRVMIEYPGILREKDLKNPGILRGKDLKTRVYTFRVVIPGYSLSGRFMPVLLFPAGLGGFLTWVSHRLCLFITRFTVGELFKTPVLAPLRGYFLLKSVKS